MMNMLIHIKDKHKVMHTGVSWDTVVCYILGSINRYFETQIEILVEGQTRGQHEDVQTEKQNG